MSSAPVRPTKGEGLESRVKLIPEAFNFGDSPVSPEQKRRLAEKTLKLEDVFSLGEFDVGCSKSTRHIIRMTEDTPFRERSRRLAPADVEDVITRRRRCPAPGSECKQDDDNQQPSVRIRMATGGKLNPVQKVHKRLLPGSSSREDDRDTGSKVPKQGQIESNVPMECGPAAEEEEQIQPRDSDVRDTEQGPGTSTSEATACQLGNSLNTELSSAQQGVEPEFTISDLLAEGGEYRLYQLTKFYRDRLKHAIEEKVERLGWMLTKEGHFSREENEKVTELTEKGNRTESSRLFLSLVNDKGSLVRRAMWESFVMWRTELPKLDRILREIQELGPYPEEYINIAQGLSELPTELTDVQQKHKETLRAQTETQRVNTILMREKVKVFQLDDRYTKLTFFPE
ncbi:uncharacterized protein [Hemitrygon akajei]|uniref:uncharacterized protein n=1 Tax=Hemitrygon akajei TaxID=2704970 RepID=UPI003BF992F6